MRGENWDSNTRSDSRGVRASNRYTTDGKRIGVQGIVPLPLRAAMFDTP